MLHDLGLKKLKLKQGDIQIMTRVSGCFDGNTVKGQERPSRVEECSQCANRR